MEEYGRKAVPREQQIQQHARMASQQRQGHLSYVKKFSEWTLIKNYTHSHVYKMQEEDMVIYADC